MSEHKHRWKMVLHVDGCHFFTSSYACDCGATAATNTERDVDSDPYSALWMENGDGDGEPCTRCRELLAGAKPDHVVEITEAA